MNWSVIFIFFVLLGGRSGTEPPLLDFPTTSHDFGSVVQGEVLEHLFQFSNQGKEPLVINNVLTSCGCTASDWPKSMVPPGEGGQIRVTFNSEGKIGRQRKIITIVSNASNSRFELTIDAFVLPKKSSFP